MPVSIESSSLRVTEIVLKLNPALGKVTFMLCTPSDKRTLFITAKSLKTSSPPVAGTVTVPVLSEPSNEI